MTCSIPHCKKAKASRKMCREHSLHFMKFTGRDYWREWVRIRDKQTCQKCGKKWRKGERRLDIHHLKGLCGRKTRLYYHRSEAKNLQTICHFCHLNLPEVRDKMSKGLKEMDKKLKKYKPKFYWENEKS